jgi:hypothetical protein
VFLPILLVVVATGSAAFMAYGTDADWARSPNGLDMILRARRLQWPAVGISLLACVGLLATVVGLRRSVWWLLALAPVLALFFHRFAPDHRRFSGVFDAPHFLEAHDPLAPADEDWIVGMVFADHALAFPYSALNVTPVVFHADYDQRVVLLFSPSADLALARTHLPELRARDLEVVSMPADGVLIYNRRLGQFISSVTGLTVDGKVPYGFGRPVPTFQTTWGQWKKRHPDTLVMQGFSIDAPRAPQRPSLNLPPEMDGTASSTPVIVVHSSPPVALRTPRDEDFPVNFSNGEQRLLLIRSPVSGRVRCFERRIGGDLFPTFYPARSRQFPRACMSDADSASLWDEDGRAIDGPVKGEVLREIGVTERAWWGIMRFWMPQLRFVEPEPRRSAGS